MEKKTNIKNLVVVAGISILTIPLLRKDYSYKPNYEIINTDNNLAYAKYSNGFVYIGNDKFIYSLENINDNDILIEEKINDGEPDIKIYSSYKIDDKDIRNEILCIILDYKDNNPSDWHRSIESMRLEWFVHNTLYSINYEPTRTMDVDFQNHEESLYSNQLLIKLLNL